MRRRIEHGERVAKQWTNFKPYFAENAKINLSFKYN
jgi:hypothetical protein